MDASRFARIARELPIFPLPGVVLLPGGLLPLHVFEPRYRALVRHVREGDGLIGVATYVDAPPGDEPAPAVHPEVGVGEIVGHQGFPDGRCNIVIQYVGAVEIEAELDSPHPFRLVRARPYTLDTRGAGYAVAGLQLMVLQLGGVSKAAGEEARKLVELDPVELTDSLARKVLQGQAAQRAYLRSERLVQRVDMMREHLAGFLAVARPIGRA